MTWSSPTEDEWAAAVEALAAPGELLLTCHLNPDGDALGSALGLGLALRRAGRQVSVSFTEPLTVPDTLAHLPGQELLVAAADAPARPDVLVTFDTGSLDRLGELAGRVESAGRVIVIDHHASNTAYGDIHLIDPSAAATAVLVAELLDRLGLSIGHDVAACLYTGISTDTGSFRYAATTPQVHQLAARLLATGIRHDLIARELYDSHPYAWVSLTGEILSRAALEPKAAGGLGLVWTYSTIADLRSRDLGMDQVEGVIDIVRTAREAEVAAVYKEQADGSWAASLRSKGRIDIGQISVDLGGGGHRFAAGFTAHGPIEVVVKQLQAALDAAPHVPG
ncbi:MAG: bifunctional oligoribonuclease/PAP phosphatase NrnA [Actinomycetota bacterium]|nr:bifunctional oligoribonuclease/PAP phosphatase NrnA [Actinomycetota bacterium]